MSLPTEADFAQVLIEDAATPGTYTVLCGLENVTIALGTESSNRYRRDCAKPGQVPGRKVRVNGRNWDISSNGVADIAQMQTFLDAWGFSRNYKVVLGQRDGTDAGKTLGTITGAAVLTGTNIAMGDEGGAREVTLAGEGMPTWAPAP